LVPASRRIGDRVVPVEVLRSEKNLGFTGGVNLGWPETSAAWVALLNNAVVLEPEWAGSLFEAMEKSQTVGSAQTIVTTADGRIDGAGIDVSTGRFLQLAHGESLASDPGEPWGVSATAAMFRMSALEDVKLDDGIFHPRFFAYYEDVELAARLRNRGWVSALVPRPLARHEGSATSVRLGRRADYLRTRNRYFVTRLHPGAGRKRALLGEDARRLLRAAAGAELGRVAAIAGGIVAGVFSRI
ncbi:MAG: glycosyltransferase family 2 protein, partial [Thermoanaerobaculia bacterium]|nr:glycosyltransferase family 2 protein [Thermoanaerobaculia bacterium]